MDTEQIEILMMMQNMENHLDFSQIIDNPQFTISSSESTPVQDLATSMTMTSSGEFQGVGNIWQGRNSLEQMREMIFSMAMMQPIHIDPESVKPLKRRNVKISKDPQSVAARRRRERISERIRILQRIVPGGTKLDTASMLDEAIHYVKFLKNQVELLECVAANRPAASVGFPVAMCSGNYGGLSENSYQVSAESVQQYLL